MFKKYLGVQLKHVSGDRSQYEHPALQSTQPPADKYFPLGHWPETCASPVAVTYKKWPPLGDKATDEILEANY